ncbi:MAG: response regulator [Candidatus Paceibacterota bacterium]|jgi:DNA-binding response OmpR family regulator
MKKNILIVEDEPSARKAMSEKFVREGFDVILAANGEEGLAMAAKSHPDLILLDVIMPKMDGITMLQKLRAESEWGASVPVVILTNITFDDEKTTGQLAKLGLEYYLVKADWKLVDIVRKIKELLNAE